MKPTLLHVFQKRSVSRRNLASQRISFSLDFLRPRTELTAPDYITVISGMEPRLEAVATGQSIALGTL